VSEQKLKIITIDGPAGGGKSTVAHLTAAALGWIYVTTGAIYRTLALLLKEAGLSSHELQNIERYIAFINERYRQDPISSRIFIGEREVTSEIKTPPISELASVIAKDEYVRSGLLPVQRRIVLEAHGAVVDGRDMGTVVFPDAPLKIFLTASPEIRAQRRFLELSKNKLLSIPMESLVTEIYERDKRDEERKLSPLKPANDAIIIDSSDKTPEEIRDMILKHVSSHFF
jgi:cytidylate kinase